MKNYYKVYIGFLDKSAQEDAIKIFTRMGWLPLVNKCDINQFDCWILAVPPNDESILWFMEESAIMEIWED